jgi:hypothetical protein
MLIIFPGINDSFIGNTPEATSTASNTSLEKAIVSIDDIRKAKQQESGVVLAMPLHLQNFEGSVEILAAQTSRHCHSDDRADRFPRLALQTARKSGAAAREEESRRRNGGSLRPAFSRPRLDVNRANFEPK